MNFPDLEWMRILSHLLSVTIAYVLALPLAWDREKEARSAGLRTFPLVAVASCGYMLLAISILGSSSERPIHTARSANFPSRWEG